MKEIFAQWYEPDDDEKIVFYFYHVKDERVRFHHWKETTREYDEDSSQFKQRTRFKLTFIK